MKTPDDETCIAMAMLHGCALREFYWGDIDASIWYARENASDPYLAVEYAEFRRSGHYWFRSREALARAWCEHYKLFDTHEAVS
jgi:hypothetical protein